jgi:hypothetical protein
MSFLVEATGALESFLTGPAEPDMGKRKLLRH